MTGWGAIKAFGGLAAMAIGSKQDRKAYNEWVEANQVELDKQHAEYQALHGRAMTSLQKAEAAEMGFRRATSQRVLGNYEDMGDRQRTGYGDMYDRGMALAGGYESDINQGYSNYGEGINTGWSGLQDNVNAGYGDRTSQFMPGWDARTDKAVTDMSALESGVNQGYGARHERGMGYLKGGDEQSRADIGERYDTLAGQGEMAMQARGFGGSTAMMGMPAMYEQEKGAELRRHDEGIRREYLDWDTRLSGDTLAARERLGGARIGMEAGLRGEALQQGQQLTLEGLDARERMGGEALGAQERVGAQGLSAQERLAGMYMGMDTSLSAARLQADERLSNAYNAVDIGFASEEAGAMRQLPEMQRQWDAQITGAELGMSERVMRPPPGPGAWTQAGQSLLGGVTGSPMGGGGGGGGNYTGLAAGAMGAGATATLGLAATTGSALAGATGMVAGGKIIGGLFTFGLAALACLHEDTPIVTRDGTKRLKDVRRGDWVLATDGQYRMVLAKDHGDIPKDRRHEYVCITSENSETPPLVCTVCHSIAGKPAGQWQTGDLMPMRINGTLTKRHVTVTSHKYVIGADLMLEDNADYLAGDFIVQSALGAFLLEVGAFMRKNEYKVA